LSNIFSIVGSALSAQNARLSVIASNLANVGSIAPPGVAPYRAHEVVFQAAPVSDGEVADGGGTASDADNDGMGPSALGVQVVGTVLSDAPVTQKYDPGSPYANSNGYVTGSNVSRVGQMVDLINTSNSYAASVAVLQQADHVDQQMLSSFQVS
jgi:flagellar basal-body rod protein FlgC